MSKSTKEFEHEQEKRVRELLIDCTAPARLMWFESRYWMDWESDRKGYVQRGSTPLSAEQLATRAGCTVETATPAVDELLKCKLLVLTDGRLHAPIVESVESYLEQNRVAVKRSKEKKALINAGGNAKVMPEPPIPPPNLPPHPPLIPPPSTPEDSAGCADGATASADRGGKSSTPVSGSKTEGAVDFVSKKPIGAGGSSTRPRAKTRERVLTDEQIEVRDEFVEWFRNVAYPQTHAGVKYDFTGKTIAGRNFRALGQIADHPDIAWNLGSLQAVATCFLRDFSCRPVVDHGHKLWDLADRIEVYLSKAKGHSNESGNRKPTRGAIENLTL